MDSNPKPQGVFVITGAGRGLGRALARKAYSQGFPLALISRTEQDLASLRLEIEEEFGRKELITIYPTDLTDEKAVDQAFKTILQQHPWVRALINNAGTWTGGKLVQELTRQEIQQSLDLNFFSAFNSIRSLLGMRSPLSEYPMSIINIGATSSLQGWDKVSAFCVAKGALRVLSQSLAREMGPAGLHVAHLIIDGLLDNDRTRRLNKDTHPEHFIKQEPLAESIIQVALQDRSCWTFEWDVRPYNESW